MYFAGNVGGVYYSDASTMLLSRLCRTKLNTNWLGRSMEHLAVTGSSSPIPSSNSVFPGTSTAAVVSTSTPSKGRHRLATDPCSTADDSSDDTAKSNVFIFKSILILSNPKFLFH